MIEKVGEGTFAFVRKARIRETEEYVAVKELKANVVDIDEKIAFIRCESGRLMF